MGEEKNKWFGIPFVPSVRLPPVRQTISNVLWRSNKKDQECFDINGLNVKITNDTKLSFEKVEHFVDDFIEVFVPEKLDGLYRINNEIKTAHRLENNEELSCKYSEADEIVQCLRKKVLDVERVRVLLLEEEIDDFDLRVHPAKIKVRQAIVDFMKSSKTKPVNMDTNHTTYNATHCRSPNARDLMSFLSSDNEQCSEIQSTSFTEMSDIDIAISEQDTMEVLHLNDDGINIEAVERLNQDLMELHALMNDLHTAVHSQGETVDTIADHIEDASDNVEKGKQQLKKATLLKAAMFPVLGAVIGGAVGGPIGFVAGMKVGSITGGVAMAGVTGTVIGYQSGKYVKKKQTVEEIPLNDMEPLKDR
ncbi:syntaxin-17-like [Ciona intestinalis]